MANWLFHTLSLTGSNLGIKSDLTPCLITQSNFTQNYITYSIKPFKSLTDKPFILAGHGQATSHIVINIITSEPTK